MTLPTITIVMPAYQVAPYIGEALESVFAQDFPDYEVIVVNDGSPDTLELESAIAPYATRITYIKQENRGVSAARNRALAVARGEFVAFLDADDLWLPTYLSEQIELIRQQNADLVCADANVFGDLPLVGRTYMDACMGDGLAQGEVTFLGLVSGAQSLITSGTLARRKSIAEVGFFDEALRDSEDFDLWLRLARNGSRLFYRRKALVKYRSRLDGLTGDETNSLRRALRAFDRLETSFELPPSERDEVVAVIRNRRAIFEYELGKVHLSHGEFKEARAAFAKANRLRKSWKKQMAIGLAWIAPNLMQAILVRRLSGAGS